MHPLGIRLFFAQVVTNMPDFVAVLLDKKQPKDYFFYDTCPTGAKNFIINWED